MNKRLNKEYNNLQKEPPAWAKVTIPDESNMLKWKATMTGPENTPYEKGLFTLDITIPQEYPFKPPEVPLLSTSSAPFLFFLNVLDLFFGKGMTTVISLDPLHVLISYPFCCRFCLSLRSIIPTLIPRLVDSAPMCCVIGGPLSSPFRMC